MLILCKAGAPGRRLCHVQSKSEAVVSLQAFFLLGINIWTVRRIFERFPEEKADVYAQVCTDNQCEHQSVYSCTYTGDYSQVGLAGICYISNMVHFFTHSCTLLVNEAR